MSEESKQAIARFWEEVFVGGDLDVMERIFAYGYELHDLVNRNEYDLAGLRGLLEAIREDVAGARDALVTIEDQMSAEGDRIVTRFTVRVPGQNYVADGEAAPVDEWVELSGISISRVSEGKIEESWINWEALRAERELRPVSGAVNWRWPPWR